MPGTLGWYMRVPFFQTTCTAHNVGPGQLLTALFEDMSDNPHREGRELSTDCSCCSLQGVPSVVFSQSQEPIVQMPAAQHWAI